ncbi:MAG: YhcH/YjgK/YiaL family protein [Mucilaginibacter sp.]
MKHLLARKGIALAVTFLFASSVIMAQTTATMSKKDADKWVKSKAYAPNLNRSVDVSVNSVEFAKQYNANKAVWDKVFAFLQNPDLANMRGGHVNIDGENGENAYAIFLNDIPKDFSQSNWEVHKKYIDVHYVIEGKEKIAGIPFAKVQDAVVTPFNDNSDIGYYKYDAFNDYSIATPENFFIYFPGEAHRPHLKVDPASTDRVKKVVIKVKYVN